MAKKKTKVFNLENVEGSTQVLPPKMKVYVAALMFDGIIDALVGFKSLESAIKEWEKYTELKWVNFRKKPSLLEQTHEEGSNIYELDIEP